MNITFLIGNGFDLRLGLKTKFSDFYDTYVERNKSNNNEFIRKFCLSLENDKAKGRTYENWSDFEFAFPKYVDSPAEIRTILEDFSDKFCDYLQEFDSNIIPDEKMIQQFKNFVFNGHKNAVNGNDQAQVQRFFDNKDNKFSYINFNYTNNLNGLLNLWHYYANNNKENYSVPYLLHIHGTKDSHIIIGIDNVNQFTNIELKNSDAA